MGIFDKQYGHGKVGVPGLVTVLVSFETGEQGAYKIFFPQAVQITGISGIVNKAIAATDAGTITGANASGASAGGVLTAAISDAIATEYTAAPTTNNTVAAGSYYKLTTLKTTAGGKVTVTVQYKTI